MTVHIGINVHTNGNAAFEDAPATEMGRILREVAKRLEDGDFPDGEVPLRDVNGNKCGSFYFHDDGE
jgi:hypothetical protein